MVPIERQHSQIRTFSQRPRRRPAHQPHHIRKFLKIQSQGFPRTPHPCMSRSSPVVLLYGVEEEPACELDTADAEEGRGEGRATVDDVERVDVIRSASW